jgi:hypothetical protein
MMELDSENSCLLWQTDRRVKWRIAVCGDFLPAMNFKGTAPDYWETYASHLIPFFNDIDYAIVNLECPLGCDGLAAAPKSGIGASLFADEAVLHYLNALKINLVGLANNHMMDYGASGVLHSHEALRSAGIEFLGAPIQMDKEPEVKIVDSGGAKIGFWSAFLNADKVRKGCTGVEAATIERSRLALAQMDEQTSCRIAIVHAGLERTHYPDPIELKCLHKFVEDGFDLVCVSHSHRISGYAAISRSTSSSLGFCFHGLGSILSGCIYGEPEREGIIPVLGLDENGHPSELSIRPLWLDGPGYGIIPPSERVRSIMDRFEQISAAIGNGDYKERFYRDMGQDLWRRIFRDFQAAFATRGLSGISSKLLRMRPKHLNRLLNKVFN